ncbi:hypothetical protein HZS_4518 [Henneguya salminicola]|nr:hypothetical protein HZS_4518 [Henneguya salminicola]
MSTKIFKEFILTTLPHLLLSPKSHSILMVRAILDSRYNLVGCYAQTPSIILTHKNKQNQSKTNLFGHGSNRIRFPLSKLACCFTASGNI